MNAPLNVLCDTTSLSSRLKAETRAAHDHTEGLPFSRQLLAGTLTADAYVAHLASHYALHAVLESSLDVASDPRLRLVWSDGRRKLAWLRADLEHYGHDGVLAPEVQDAIDAFAQRVREWRRSQPLTLLGALYVFEGSTLGGAFLRPRLAEMFELSDGGIRYYTGYGRATGSTWKAFRASVDALPMTSSEADAIVDAASETFIHVGEVLRAIVP